MHLKSIRDAGVEGKCVVLRAGLNLPVQNGKVVDDFRLSRALTTVQFLLECGAKLVILAHLGREGESLSPVRDVLAARLPNVHIQLAEGELSTWKAQIDMLPANTIFLGENVRRCAGEEENNLDLAKQFAALGDLFVNDAFADSHRTHASVVGIQQFLPSYAGLLVEEEVTRLSEAFSPSHPALAIIGGAKFETKEPLIERLVEHYDRVCVGGALVNDFFKACGYDIGTSLVSEKVPSESLLKNQRVELPSDIVVTSGTAARTTMPTDVKSTESIADAGPATGQRWATYINDASFVLLNGPLGIYEKGFTTETEALARAIVASKAKAVIGGGDTTAAMHQFSFDEGRVFVSTGGGAMLQFLVDGTLVGLEGLYVL